MNNVTTTDRRMEIVFCLQNSLFAKHFSLAKCNQNELNTSILWCNLCGICSEVVLKMLREDKQGFCLAACLENRHVAFNKLSKVCFFRKVGWGVTCSCTCTFMRIVNSDFFTPFSSRGGEGFLIHALNSVWSLQSHKARRKPRLFLVCLGNQNWMCM